jgi:hypothetical protein
MNPTEKAVNALNHRLERLQANLREAQSEQARRFLLQSLVVTAGMGEAMTDYIKQVGHHAQRRQAEFKQTTAALGARHADLLKSGSALLEQLKAKPTDRALRQEIDRMQQDMAAIQKNLRRGAHELQSELSLIMAMIDEIAVSVRRLSEAEQADSLKRVLKRVVEYVRELYAGLETTRQAKDVIDATAWEQSAVSGIDPASDFYDAYARAVYQAMLAFDLMTMAVSENPPATAEEATHRANESAAVRVKDITTRFTAT